MHKHTHAFVTYDSRIMRENTGKYRIARLLIIWICLFWSRTAHLDRKRLSERYTKWATIINVAFRGRYFWNQILPWEKKLNITVFAQVQNKQTKLLNIFQRFHAKNPKPNYFFHSCQVATMSPFPILAPWQFVNMTWYLNDTDEM